MPANQWANRVLVSFEARSARELAATWRPRSPNERDKVRRHNYGISFRTRRTRGAHSNIPTNLLPGTRSFWPLKSVSHSNGASTCNNRTVRHLMLGRNDITRCSERIY